MPDELSVERGGSGLSTWSALLPVASLAATLGVILHRLPVLLGWVQNSDSVGPMLIAESVGHIPHGARVTMASEANLTMVGLDVLTRWVPGHRTLWVLLPFLSATAAITVMALTVRVLAGGRAAMLCAAIAVVLPPLLLTPLLAHSFHTTSFFLLAISGSLLTWQARSAAPMAPQRLVVFAVLGMVGGIELLSDHLFFIGLASLCGAAVLLWVQRRDRQARDVALVALATAVLALLVWRLASAWAVQANIHSGPVSSAPASPHRVLQNLALLRDVVLTMVNGQSRAPGPLPLRIVCGVVAAAAIAVLLWTLLRLAWRGLAAARRGAGPSGVADVGVQSRGGLVFSAYWALVGGLLLAAYLFSQIPIDISSIRYLVPLLWAVAALVPLVAARSAVRMALAGGAVAVVGLYGAAALNVAIQDEFQLPQRAEALVATLQSLGVHHGYAGYWQGDMLTWQSGGDIVSRGVFQSPACDASQPGWFCPYLTNTVQSWYAPSGTGPTFLIVEDGSPFFPSPLPDSLRPARTVRVDRFTVYVFDGDVGAEAARHTAGWWPPGPVAQPTTATP